MSHGEKERTEDYKEKQWKSRRHRRCVERRSLFGNSISNLYTKRLFQNIYQEYVGYISVALCAVGTSVTLRYLRPSVTPCAYYIRLLVYHSIFQKNLFLSHLRFEFSLHSSGENTPKNTPKQPFLNVFITNSISNYCRLVMQKVLNQTPKGR